MESQDISVWKKVFCEYQNVLEMKASKISAPAKRKELLKLDMWYQNELPGIIAAREDKYITKTELCQLMKWKLTDWRYDQRTKRRRKKMYNMCYLACHACKSCKTVTQRGKFRPRLTELVAMNSDDAVITASTKAFNFMPDLTAAIKCLVVLKAIGPATASAVLAAGCPDNAAFMADESILAIPGLTPIEYTLKFYLSYAERIKQLLRKLNQAKCTDTVSKWTAHDVELTLWTYQLGKTLGVPMPVFESQKVTKRPLQNKQNKGTGTGKRKRDQ